MNDYDPSGMIYANAVSVQAKGNTAESFRSNLRRLSPDLVVDVAPHKRAYFKPAGNKYPGFDTRVTNRRNGRSVYLNIGVQGDEGQAAYERRHRYMSLYPVYTQKGVMIGIIILPEEPMKKSKKYDFLLQEAARVQGLHPKIGYLCTDDEARILKYCSDLAEELGAHKNIL